MDILIKKEKKYEQSFEKRGKSVFVTALGKTREPVFAVR